MVQEQVQDSDDLCLDRGRDESLKRRRDEEEIPRSPSAAFSSRRSIDVSVVLSLQSFFSCVLTSTDTY